MMTTIAALADRILRVVVPDTTAGACACFPGDADGRCYQHRVYICTFNCYCDVLNCTATAYVC